jgi:hypothetical protein
MRRIRFCNFLHYRFSIDVRVHRLSLEICPCFIDFWFEKFVFGVLDERLVKLLRRGRVRGIRFTYLEQEIPVRLTFQC